MDEGILCVIYCMYIENKKKKNLLLGVILEATG